MNRRIPFAALAFIGLSCLASAQLTPGTVTGGSAGTSGQGITTVAQKNAFKTAIGVGETWVFEGDSWMQNEPGNDRNTFTYYLARNAPATVTCVNVATQAQTAQTMLGTLAAQVGPYYPTVTGKAATCFYFAGINDGGSRTTTQLRDDLRSAWAAMKAGGMRVVAFTLPYRNSGGWSQADWLTINTQIIADGTGASPLYDVLVRTDLFHPSNTVESDDGLHIVTGAHQKLGGYVMDALESRAPWPSLTPDLVCSAVGSVNFVGSTGGRRNIPFTEKYDSGNNATNTTYGGDTATVFTAPITGTYEITSSMILGGMSASNTAYLSAYIVLSGAAELEHRLDYQISPGANMTLKGTIRRRLTRGDTVAIAVTVSNTATTILQNAEFSAFNVRLVSIP